MLLLLVFSWEVSNDFLIGGKGGFEKMGAFLGGESSSSDVDDKDFRLYRFMTPLPLLVELPGTPRVLLTSFFLLIALKSTLLWLFLSAEASESEDDCDLLRALDFDEALDLYFETGDDFLIRLSFRPLDLDRERDDRRLLSFFPNLSRDLDLLSRLFLDDLDLDLFRELPERFLDSDLRDLDLDLDRNDLGERLEELRRERDLDFALSLFRLRGERSLLFDFLCTDDDDFLALLLTDFLVSL